MLKSPLKVFTVKKSPLNIIKTLVEAKQTQRTFKLHTSKSTSTIYNSTSHLGKHQSMNQLILKVTIDKPQRTFKLVFPYSSQTLIGQLVSFLKAEISQTFIFFKAKDFSIDYFLTLTSRRVQELQQQKLQLAAIRIKIDKNGHRIKDLEIIKCLGTGGFSKVYLARGYGKFMAIKVINKAFILNNEKDTIVQSERAILQKCNKHPFITQFYLSLQTPNYLVFCMEYCNGGQLFNLLRKVRRMKEADARFYFLQTLAAISHLHSQNILYRDLKPQNIIIDSEGHIRLADYGLSKMMRERTTYSFCGSAEYMAPQMLLKTGHGFEMDYYCLGALFYELLIGLPPYYSRDQKELFSNILNKELQFPPGIELSQDLKTMLRRLLQKDTDLRFKNIQQIFSSPYLQNYNLEDILAKKLIPPFKTNMFQNNFDNNDFIEGEQKEIMRLNKQKDQVMPFEEVSFPYFGYVSEDLVKLQEQIEKNKSKKLNFTKKPSVILQAHRKQITWRNSRSINTIDNSQFFISQHQTINSPRLTSNYDKFKVFSSQTSQPSALKTSQMIHTITPILRSPTKFLSPQKARRVVNENKGFSSPLVTKNYIHISSSQLNYKINEYLSPQGKSENSLYKKNIGNSSSLFKNLTTPSVQIQKNVYLQNNTSNNQGYLSNFKERFNPNKKIKKSYKTNDRSHFNFFLPNTLYKQL